MKHWINSLAIMAVLIIMGACASIGRPQGGPRDETPPVYVRSNPPAGAVDVSPSRIDIFFDENIKVEDVVNKVVVSPVQKQLPTVNANGRRLTVNFRDTLLPDVTYTVDFADAIRDLNEGNVLDGFAFDFSTGHTRDSLVIAGKLFEARNLEPAQGMLVGVHSDLSDTALTSVPLLRIAKTNQLGEFVIRNLAPGSYRLYAIDDVNRNYLWDRSENVAFLDSLVLPCVEQIIVSDTLKTDAGADSIATRSGVRYLPNDLLLTWFNENYSAQYLRSYNRPDSMKITMEMGAPSDTLPEITLINGSHAGTRLDQLSLLNRSAMRDTLEYWLTDPALISQDTILASVRYLRTDSLQQLAWTTDTLRFTFRAKAQKEKNADKKIKLGDNSDSIAKANMRFLSLRIASSANQELNRPLQITTGEPIANIDSTAIRLKMQVDTTWHTIADAHMRLDSLHKLLDYSIDYNWKPGARYRLEIDSAAITSIYGVHNKRTTAEFNVKTPDDYSTLTMRLTSVTGEWPMILELLNQSDATVMAAPVTDGVAHLEYVDPGTYYVRAFVDRNGDGRWTTGSIADRRQPEDVYYYSKKINIKKNWDIDQTWDLDELPVDRQKPYEIIKNKPKLKAGEKAPVTDDANPDTEADIDPFTGRPYNSDAYGRGGNAASRNASSLTPMTR